MSRKLECDTHGATPWDGECVCSPEDGGCGTLHHAGIGEDPVACCDAFDIKQPSKTLRAICRPCFDKAGGAGAKVVTA